jgi:hypothetical protein
MKVVEKLKDQPDSGALLVEVAEHEIADIDAMAMMIDGGSGEYSVDVRLVGTNVPPCIETIADHRIPLRPKRFCKPEDLRSRTRYYEVRVARN